MTSKESDYQCKTCENVKCWLCKGNVYYDRVMESKSCDAKSHKSDIFLFRDFTRLNGCCSHSKLKNAKRKYYEYRSHSGHLYMLLYELLGEEYVESHELDECLKLALNKISDYEDLINITDEEVDGLEDIIGFAFSHRQGMIWKELEFADNLYHKIKDVYLLQQLKKLHCTHRIPQSEVIKTQCMADKKDLYNNGITMDIHSRKISGNKDHIIFKPIRHRDGD